MANILFITSSLSFGGAAKMLSFVANSLAKRSHKICIVNLHSTRGESGAGRRMEQGVLVKSLHSKDRLHQIQEISKIAKDFKADVLIGFTEMPNTLAKIVGTLNGKPSIMSERGDPKRTFVGKGWKSRLTWRIINMSAGGVFQTVVEGVVQPHIFFVF